MKISLSPAAIATLDRIRDWNAQTHGTERADRYIDFLLAETAKLERLSFAGKPVPARPALSYVTIKKRRGGHGHVAVYELIGETVYILNYYHTAQDWQNKLLDKVP